MTSLEHTGTQDNSTLPDDLPLLTEVVADESLDAIPVLTEIISGPPVSDLLISPDNEIALDATTGSPTDDSPENNIGSMAAGDDLPDLTDLPDIAEAEIPPPGGPEESAVIAETDAASPSPLDNEEMQQLLHQLETHIETVLREKLSRDTVLTEKLSLKLEQLQQLAITQAIDEIKAELPDLLRDALNARTKL